MIWSNKASSILHCISNRAVQNKPHSSAWHEHSSESSRSRKEKKKSLMQKGVWRNWHKPHSSLFKRKVMQSMCLACTVSFNSFRATINGLDKIHIPNWLSSTGWELHFIPYQTTSITFLMVFYAFWTGRVTELHCVKSHESLCYTWAQHNPLQSLRIREEDKKNKKRGMTQDLPLSKAQVSVKLSSLSLLSS